MDKLKDIRREAKQIARSGKTKSTRTTAKKIGRQAEHELGEIRRGEWKKVKGK